MTGNKKLINFLKTKPKLYETNNIAFWDDRHISKSMLKAHLDPEYEGASRKHSFIKRSVRWITSLNGSVSEKKLLDLGCGPGIYAEMLCDKGFEITGIDISKRSVAYAKSSAKRKKLNIRYINKDYLKIDYKEKFDDAILIYCDFGVLPAADGKKLLKKIYASLKPGGIFVMDVFTERQYDDFKEGAGISYEADGFWQTGKYLHIKNNRRYQDKRTYLEQHIIVSDNKIKNYFLWNKAFSKNELTALLRQAGFGKISFYEDVRGTPFNKKSKTICAVSERS